MKRLRSRKGAPGIVEVAARAGVSPATVSRSFNQPEMVREPTRLRIGKAAAELGYIRDRLAGALQNRYSGTVGLVVPTIDNAIFAEMIEAFGARLRDHDRTMLIAAHGYDLNLEVGIVRSLLERRIDGVALIGFDHQAVPLAMLAERDVPVISVWNYRQNSAIPCIGTDNAAAAAMTTRHLTDLGHREIVFIFPDVTTNDRARDRMNGALAQARLAGIETPVDRMLCCPYDIGEAKRLALEVLARDCKSRPAPTAFVCGNDIIAHGVMYASYALGLDVPADVSIVGIGDFGGSGHLEPGLTTVRLPARRIGRLAADALILMSETGLPPDPYCQALDFQFIERGSTAPPRVLS